jgi:hypothetical protein
MQIWHWQTKGRSGRADIGMYDALDLRDSE